MVCEKREDKSRTRAQANQPGQCPIESDNPACTQSGDRQLAVVLRVGRHHIGDAGALALLDERLGGVHDLVEAPAAVVQPFDLRLETAGWELESTTDESSGKHIRLLVVKSTRRNSVGVARVENQELPVNDAFLGASQLLVRRLTEPAVKLVSAGMKDAERNALTAP